MSDYFDMSYEELEDEKRWITEGIENEDPNAMYAWARMSERFQNSFGANFWRMQADLIKLAKADDINAQNTIAYGYYTGEGIAKDSEKAVYWYTKAAEQGNADSQYALGCCYQEGDGVEPDDKKALLWFEKAAKQGHAKATEKLQAIRANKNEDKS